MDQFADGTTPPGLYGNGKWTRSPDGRLGEIKPGIAVLVSRARVPVVPAGIAGTFEAWPRSRLLPRFHALRIHYGRPIDPAELDGLDADAITGLIRERLRESVEEVEQALTVDLGGSSTPIVLPASGIGRPTSRLTIPPAE